MLFEAFDALPLRLGSLRQKPPGPAAGNDRARPDRGKRESGSSPEARLAQEITKETGLQVEVNQLLECWRYQIFDRCPHTTAAGG